jgi:EmrB/QacA subfamily drug resistance transporter
MDTVNTSPPDFPPPGLAASPRRWLALAALTLSVLIVGLDSTIINVALPTLSREIGANNSQLQWISGGYLLALSAAMLPAGMLGDRHGHKRLLIAGMVLFGAGSLGGALVHSTGEVIAARSVLGLGAAMITPLSMAILTRIFPKEELQRAIAVWTGATAVGLPVGPVVGGWLLSHFWWGSIFLFNVPVVGIALVAGLWLLPSDKGRPPRTSQPFDGIGTVLSAVGIIALVYGAIEQPDKGWGSGVVIGSLAVGVVLLVAFVLRQRSFSHPLIDLALFSDRRFLWGTTVAVLVMFAVDGILFVVPQFLQGVQGSSSFATGLKLLPLIGGLMLAAGLSDSLVPKFGARAVIPLGLLLLAAGGLLGATTTAGEGYGSTVVWLAMCGLGFGLSIVPGTSVVMSSLPPENSGSGTSLLETLQQMGGVLGVAALGSVLATGYVNRLVATGLSPDAAQAARSSVSGADDVAAQTHDNALLLSAHQAFAHGMDLVLIVCAAVALIAAVLAAIFIPGKVAAEEPARDTAPDGQQTGQPENAPAGS